MQQIRAFEEERKNWENERREWEETKQALASQKSQVESELARLNQEVEQLRAGAGQASSPVVRVETSANMRSHHEKQVMLMVMIDDLRRDLHDEQARTRALEQKGLDAEKTNRRLTAELERLRRASTDGDSSGQRSAREKLGNLSSRMSTSSIQSSADLSITLETSRGEVRSLEDETLRLREELNGEKQKVIELKRAAHTRAAAWKAELQNIQEELSAKHALEEELAIAKQEINRLSDREKLAIRETTRLQRELEGGPMSARRSARPEELEVMASTFSEQLVAVEQELQAQMKKSSQLLEHFLHHAHDPAAAVRRVCRKIAKAAGWASLSRSAPPLFEVDQQDLPGNLMKVLDLIRFAADALEAHEQQEACLDSAPNTSRRDSHRDTHRDSHRDRSYM